MLHTLMYQVDLCYTDMKPFVFDSALVDPLDIARRDQMEFFIEKISDHRGKLSDFRSSKITPIFR